jgi:glycosidase
MHDQAHQSYWQKNSPIAAIQSYNSYLPSVMDFTLLDAFNQAFNEKNQNWDQGMIRVYDNFVNDFMYANPNNMLLFMENHDTQRFNEIYSNIKDYKLALTILATVRGIPQIYYGTEIGMKGNKNLGDADIRRDFPGGWKDDKENAFNPIGTENGRNQDHEEYFNFTKKILNWRLNNKAVQEGKTIQFIPENNVYVFFRILPTEKVMVIVNNSESEQTLNLNRFREVISTGKMCKDLISGSNINLENEKIIVGAKTSMIIEIK